MDTYSMLKLDDGFQFLNNWIRAKLNGYLTYSVCEKITSKTSFGKS